MRIEPDPVRRQGTNEWGQANCLRVSEFSLSLARQLHLTKHKVAG
jgi:hypothetical protein